jgi:hypothetical protein
MRWAGYIAQMVEKRHAYRVRRGKLKETNRSEEVDVEGTIILKEIFKE